MSTIKKNISQPTSIILYVSKTMSQSKQKTLLRCDVISQSDTPEVFEGACHVMSSMRRELSSVEYSVSHSTQAASFTLLAEIGYSLRTGRGPPSRSARTWLG